jgi:hypothetical protein
MLDFLTELLNGAVVSKVDSAREAYAQTRMEFGIPTRCVVGVVVITLPTRYLSGVRLAG